MTAQEPYATSWEHKLLERIQKSMSLHHPWRVLFLVRTYNIYLNIVIRWYRLQVKFWQGLHEFVVGIRVLFSI